jgi:hypothetical protein
MKNWFKWFVVVTVAIVAFYFLRGFGKGLASSTAPLP